MAPAEGLEEGMRTLLAAREKELAGGAAAVGWKVGLNGPAVQSLLGLDGLVVGYINDGTVVSPGATVDVSSWTAPTLEVEVALRVGPDGMISAVAPALELVDLDLPFDRLQPILAGDLFHRGVVFGDEYPPDACEGLEVRVMSLSTGNELAAAPMADDPAVTLQAVRTFLAAHGAVLEPGLRVIAGSMTSPLPVADGDGVHVDFGRLGSLEVSFSAG
jgi:2-oxo-hept-3-ene-1,7-dioate hydratase